METVLLEIKDKKAYQVLKALENMNVIRIIDKPKHSTEKLSRKYAGKISPEVADQLQEYIIKSRKEWNDRNI